MDKRRVVRPAREQSIPWGTRWEGSWKRILAGESGIGPITLFDAASCPVRFAAEVKDFDITRPLAKPLKPFPDKEPLAQALPPKDVRRYGRFAHLGIYAGLPSLS